MSTQDNSIKEQITTLQRLPRCVNLDWLEVHAREPITRPQGADFFRAYGWQVQEREYGTRVYREMFTLIGTDGTPLIEVRRNPASQGLMGIHDPNECHIRLVNRACYYDNAAAFFRDFLNNYGYEDVRISRVDVCMDFVRFDKGDDPQAFVRRYFRHKYAKINQGRISAHGDDTWTGQEWNSLSWGSKHSAVTTKMYNKTMELFDVHTKQFRKPYIRYAWLLCGFVDDYVNVTKNGEQVQVWRVEFSLKSAVKNWVKIEIDGDRKQPQSLRNTLDVWDSRDKLLIMFASLANHYFRFKKYKRNQRKDRCPDKVLFCWKPEETVFQIGRDDYTLSEGNPLMERFEALIDQLRHYQNKHPEPDIVKACGVLIKSMTEDNMRRDISSPWNKEEMALLMALVNGAADEETLRLRANLDELKSLLNINDKTLQIN